MEELQSTADDFFWWANVARQCQDRPEVMARSMKVCWVLASKLVAAEDKFVQRKRRKQSDD